MLAFNTVSIHRMRRALCPVALVCLATLAPSLPLDAAEMTKGTLADGTEHIHIDGPIEQGDDRAFERLSRGVTRGIVSIDSLGGSIETAISIGRIVRDRNFDTIVGIVKDYGTLPYCYSSCSLIFLGGRKLYAATDATISSNRSNWVIGSNPLPPNYPMFGAQNTEVVGYLEKLSYSPEFIKFITVPSADVYGELTFAKAKNYGISILRKSQSPFGTPVEPQRKEQKMSD
jgi:hypothetical protein